MNKVRTPTPIKQPFQTFYLFDVFVTHEPAIFSRDESAILPAGHVERRAAARPAALNANTWIVRFSTNPLTKRAPLQLNVIFVSAMV